MLTYLRQLQDERDSLTQTATALADSAVTDHRDLTETEAASLASMQQRCAAIDNQLTTYSAQVDSQRAYAALRSHLTADAPDDDAQSDQPNGNGRNRQPEPLSWGEQFVGSPQFRAYSGRGSSQLVTLGSAIETRAALTTGDNPYPPQLVPAPALPTFPNTLLGLVQQLRTSSGSVAWIRSQPVPANAAPVVAEGALKPEMALTLELIEQSLQTYAHYKAITRQALDDIPQVQSLVESYLRAGLAIAIEAAIATAIDSDADVPTVTGPGLLGAVRIGMARVQTNGFTPNGLLLNPNDWASIDLIVLGATLNGPTVNSTPFGLRIAASPRIPEGTAYVGDFREGVTVFDRGVTNVYLTDSHADYFLRNQLVLLGEARALPVVTNPTALAACSDAGGGTAALTVQAQPAS